MPFIRRTATTRLVAAVAGGLAVVAATVSPAAATAAATASPAATTATVPGTVPQLVRGATDLGPATTGRLTVTLALPLQDQSGLRSLLAGLYDRSSPDYRRFLTPAAFADRFGPSAAAVQAVASWAEGAGLAVSSVSANRTLVQVTGSLAAVGRAFGVGFHRYAAGGRTYVSSTSAATVPASLGLLSVTGLSTLDRVGLSPLAAPTVSFPTSYDPQQFWSFYDAPAGQTGAGEAVAVIATGTVAQPKADLATFEQRYDLPVVPWTTVPTGPASTTTAGDDEWDLDTQYATGLAGEVSSLLVYDGSSLTDATILTEIARWVTDDQAGQANFSAGECELLADASGFLPANDQTLEQAVAQGQTLFGASGDTGASCPVLVAENGVPVGLPDVTYPAASPYAVGVGGTTILGAPSPLREVGWYAGGGGPAVLEPEPSDQAAVGGSNLGLSRGVPDVAFDADPDSGFDVVVNGQTEVVGGTSGSSPAWMGIWARAQAAHGGTLGFAGDTIYAEPAASFNDVTVGSNIPYPCTPGYDYVTGRGTPDIAAFVGAA
ncbi:MAG TPA: S53 family peptidase [Acidimicrobiales bacterium]|nr:S53 family peptidase [Acidimicrobiales bacterium]